MKYELLDNLSRGLIIDNCSVFGDVKSTYEIDFLLPDSECYIALFKGVNGVEFRQKIEQCKVKLPKELLKQEQFVDLKVLKVINDKIVKVWECDPLRITALCNLRKGQWELSGVLTENFCKDKLDEHEKAIAENKDNIFNLALKQTSQQEVINGLLRELETKTRHITELENKINETIVAINNLSERVEFMENNYNPLEV